LQIGEIDFALMTISVRRSAWEGKIHTKSKASETALAVSRPLSQVLK
jgi:hypothetical protein